MICRGDVAYAMMDRELRGLSTDQLSEEVAKKMRQLYGAKKQLQVATVATTHAAAVPQVDPSTLPVLATSDVLSRMVDLTRQSSMRLDSSLCATHVEGRDAGSGYASSFRSPSAPHSENSTYTSLDQALWRCSLCGTSLLRRATFSCCAHAPAEVPRSTLPRFHHFCEPCVKSLRSGNISTQRGEIKCPLCDRLVPNERNLTGEVYALSL